MGANYNYQTTWTFTTQNDLSNATAGTGAVAKAINYDTGDIAADGLSATGILVAAANSGASGTYGDTNKIPYTAAHAISSASLPLTPTTSGYMTIASDGDWAVGRSIAAVTSGSVADGIFNFATPQYVASGGAIF